MLHKNQDTRYGNYIIRWNSLGSLQQQGTDRKLLKEISSIVWLCVFCNVIYDLEKYQEVGYYSLITLLMSILRAEAIFLFIRGMHLLSMIKDKTLYWICEGNWSIYRVPKPKISIAYLKCMWRSRQDFRLIFLKQKYAGHNFKNSR
jgi:hypothetical protein